MNRIRATLLVGLAIVFLAAIAASDRTDGLCERVTRAANWSTSPCAP